jgi:hypothetical protein
MNDEMKTLETSRRDFLKKAAKVAVYVPPAMLALSTPSFKAIAQSAGTTIELPPKTSDFDFETWLRDLVERLRAWYQ